MKTLLLIAAVALALCAAVTSGLECYNCVYVEGDEDTDEGCQAEFGSLTAVCEDLVYPNITENENRFYYCARYLGTNEEDGEFLIRNCFTKQDGSEATEDELRTQCNFGLSHSFNDESGNPTHEFTTGDLCLCVNDFCNSANSMGLHLALLGIGLFTTMRLFV